MIKKDRRPSEKNLKKNNMKFPYKEGTISFWIPKNFIKYNDNKTHILVNRGNEKGSIFIVKDNDNKMKFFHVIIGEGRTDVEIDVKNLSTEKKHMITATWNFYKKENKLYIDGGIDR